MNDTALDATDYREIFDGNLLTNPPMTLSSSDPEYCKRTCQSFNLENGMRCWTIEMTNKCRLYFFPSPMVLANPELVGKSPGKTLLVRQCPEVVQCKATAADIVLAVDSSGSIGAENFEKIRSFLENLIMSFDIDGDFFTRIGLMLYNDNVNWQFKLGELSTKLDMLKAIQKMIYVKGGTMTHAALEEVRNEGFVNNRTGVPHLVIVLTDGLSRLPGLTKLRAAYLREMGLQVYAIGVGNHTNPYEIFNIASSPEDKYIYSFDTFDDLDVTNLTFAVNYVPCKDVLLQNISTTVAPGFQSNCTDTVDNCASYGRDMCTDYAPWAHAHCALYCEFCQGPPMTVGPCVDTLPNCASYGSYICEDKAYVNWVNKNCQKFCGVCSSGETTTAPTTLATTTPVPICEDTIDTCAGYKASCKDKQYEPYLKSHCAETCGFCKSHETYHGHTVNGQKCPDWYLPVECDMEVTDSSCCPLPKCPAGYVTTAELDL